MTRVDPIVITSPYICYERLSVKQDELMAIERQRADNTAKARQLKWPKPQHIHDEKSAWRKRGARPAFNAMVDAIRSGTIRGVIVWNLDRLLRRMDELEILIEAVESAPPEFQIATAQGDINLATSDGRAFARILVTMAQKASDDTSRRVKRYRQDHPLELPIYGDRSDEERAALTVILERALAGDSLSSIARHLNATGAPTARKNMPDTSWQVSTLSRILRNPRMIERGYITPADFQRLDGILAHPHHGRSEIEYLLAGVLVCGRCGRKLVGGGRATGAGNRGRYQCAGTKGCGMSISPAIDYDALIVAQIRDRIAKEGEALAGSVVEPGDDAARTKILAKLRSLDEKLERDEISFDRWERLNATLTAQLPATTITPITIPALDEFDQGMAGSIAERRATMARAIESITVAPGTRGKKGIDRERLYVQARSRR